MDNSINKKEPCIYRELKHCGKKFYFFYDEENLLLTKKSGFEILVTRKMNEWKIDKKYQPQIIQSLEILLPIMVLLIAGFLLAPRK
jgi:hypothetical protein